MSKKATLDSSALSAFCESMALMHSAGIQTDEAVHMLMENMEDSSFKRACECVYKQVIAGSSLAHAMAQAGVFPRYAVDMIAVGERSGRLEDVLRSLSVYYDEEARMMAKIRSAIGYPAALLCIMSVILAFTVLFILPVFEGVYDSLSGGITSGSFDIVAISVVIGWIALIVTLICAVVALVVMAMMHSEGGVDRVVRLLENVPFTKKAMHQLALSRFTSVVSVFIASGLTTDQAMKDALATVEHRGLFAQVEQAYNAMIDPEQAKSLAQAISDFEIFEPVYARMLTVGTRAGSLDEVLDRLAGTFFDDAILQVDRVIDSIEPALAAFLTIAVGATLISVMLPLIGIMGSIG